MKTQHNIIAIAVIGIALAIVIVVVGGFSWGNHVAAPVPQQTAQNNPPVTATSTASSTVPAKVYTPHPPHGSVTYEIAEAATQLPGFVQATIDPLDVSVGQVQHFTIVTDDPNPVVSVVAKIVTDHKTITVPLVSKGAPAVSMLLPRTMVVDSANHLALVTPTKGSNNVADTGAKQGANIANAATANKTEFTGQWTVEDTHATKYQTTFIAKDSLGNENSVTLGWTDPCPFTSVNNYNNGISYSGNCNVAGIGSGLSPVDGPEHGYLYVNGTITFDPNSILVINSNYNITFAGGSIATIPPSSKILFNQEMYGTDNDGDGYIVGSWNTTGGTSRVNLGGAGVDCNDSDARAHPGGSSYTSAEVGTPGPGGAWDFNCDGVVTQSYGGGGSISIPGNCNGPYTCQTPSYTAGTVSTACGSMVQQVVQVTTAACLNNGQPTGQHCAIWGSVSTGNLQSCY